MAAALGCPAIAYAMKIPKKSLVVFAAALALAAIGLVQGMNALLARNRDQVRQELQKVIGKDVSFGDLEVVWFGRPGFVVEEFRIADDPHFAATPLVRSQELILGISLWNLLFQRLVISRLTFIAPELQIITNESGSLNLANLLERKNELRDFPALPPVISERKRAGLSFAISRIEIREGRIEYVDRSIKEPSELHIRHLSMTVKGFEPKDTLQFRVTASLTPGLGRDTRIDGRLDPAPKGSPWSDREANLDLQFDSLYAPVVAHAIAALRNKIPSDLDVTGPMALRATIRGTPRRPRIDNITLKIPLWGSSDYNAIATGSVAFSERRSWEDAKLQGKLTMDPLPLPRLRALNSLEFMLPENLIADGTISAYMLFEGTWDHLRIGALVRADKAALGYKNLLYKPVEIPAEIRARIYRQRNEFQFDNSEFMVGGNEIGFAGALVYEDSPRLQLKLIGEQEPIAAWSKFLALPGFAIQAGKADWNITFEKKLLRDDDTAWKLGGQMSISGAQLRHRQTGQSLKDLDGKVSFSGKQARFDQVTFRVGESKISLNALAENIADRRATYSLASARLNLAELPLNTVGPPLQLEQVDAKGDVRLQNDGLVLTGVLTAAGANLYPLRFQNLRSEIAITALALSFNNLSAQIANGLFHSNGYWAAGEGHAQQFELSSDANAVELRGLLDQLWPAASGRFAGLLSGQARFSASASDGASIGEALNGSGEASVQQGMIKNFNLINHLLLGGSGAGSLSRLPPSLAAVVSRKDTPLESLKTNFTVEQKRIRTENLVITTPDYTITGGGWIGFDRATDWNGLMVFSPRITQEFQRDYRLIRYLLDRRGRLAVSFRLEGKIPNVKVRFDNRALAQALRAGRGDDRDTEAKSNQEPKQPKRWIPDAIERFLNR